MSDPQTAQNPAPDPQPDEIQSALFAQLIMQQANLAMMLMGKTPHPESGKPVKDIEGARLFIDTLEMLERKTRGNLSRDEANLLKQSLMGLRLAFVEAVESEGKTEPAPQGQPTTPSKESPGPAPGAPETPPPAGTEEESHKKFSKKY